MKIRTLARAFAPLLLIFALFGCKTIDVGGGDAGAVSGSSGSAGSEGSVELKRCPQPLAAVALSAQQVKPDVLVQFGVPEDPLPAMRLILAQSNCAQVVHRDVALQALQQERALAEAGELRDGKSFGGGQMVAADYTLIPEITFSNENASGIGAAAAGILSRVAPLVGLAAGAVNFSEAQVLLTLVDNRSGVQTAVATGTASGTSFAGLGALGGLSVAGAAGGYMNTDQGKVVMAAMVDAMNNLQPHLVQTASAARAQ